MIVFAQADTSLRHFCNGLHEMGGHEWFYVGLASAIIFAILGGKVLREIKKSAG